MTILLVADFLEDVAVEGEEAWSEELVRTREEEMVRIDEAVVSLARAVLSEGGRIAFADHPLLTPLIGQIAAEYPEPVELERPRPEEPSREVALALVFPPAIGRRGSVELDWLSSIGLVDSNSKRPGTWDAAVFIGGQEAQLPDWNASDWAAPRFSISSTGGAAGLVNGDSIDESLWQEVSSLRSDIPRQDSSEIEELVPEFRYAVYPLVMARIVDKIAPKGDLK